MLSSICLEGLGRKFLPGLPQFAWYFLKDAVLLTGLVAFGPMHVEVAEARRLYRGFGVFLGAAFLWTLFGVLNTGQTSLALGFVGLRAYWLWWLAPLVVARALRRADDRDWAVAAIAVFSVGIAALAAVQFQFPSDAVINKYAWSGEGEGVVTVGETGRVRVTSTFAYLTGFTDFGILGLVLLLALGLGATKGTRKTLCYVGAAALAVTLPMSGARAAVVLGAVSAAAVILGAGFLRSKEGRGILAAAGLLLVVGWVAVPEAVAGVRSRFEGADTSDRFEGTLEILPPVALAQNEYPMLGLGTGMQQNVRGLLGVRTEWATESEYGRYLVELGPLGYLLMWTARLGIVVALLRGMVGFRRSNRRALAGASLAFAALAFLGNMTFDHVWQALYFTGLGLLLQAAVAVRAEHRIRSRKTPVVNAHRVQPA